MKRSSTLHLLGVALFLTTSLAFHTGCSSAGNLRNKRLTLAASAGSVGAVYGYSQAPQDQKTETHAALTGAALATFGFILGEYFFSDQELVLQEQKRQLELQSQMKDHPQPRRFKTLFTYKEPKVLGRKSELLLPANTQVLVFETDEWKHIDGKWLHQNLLYEFHPE